MKTAIFPGSFDPITKGHEDIALRALRLFDNLIIAIGQKDFRNPKQSTMDFYIATKEEELKPIGNKAEAYKFFLKNKKE